MNAMNTNTNLDFSYRAALALNNMGVSLLEQGCFNESLRLFKDSLSILKGMLGFRFGDCNHHDQSNSTSIAAAHDERNVQLKMQSATILLAECQMGRSKTEPSEAADVYALDHGDLTLMKDALRYGSSSGVVFPVYLRSTAAFDKDVEQQVAVVLYNISVAILLNHAHGSMDTTTDEQQQECNSLLDAFQYLSIAQTILSQSIEDTNNHDEDQRLVSMLLTAMVLNMLVQAYKRLNWHQKEQDAMSSLLLLESIVNEQEAATSIAGYLSCQVIPPAA